MIFLIFAHSVSETIIIDSMENIKGKIQLLNDNRLKLIILNFNILFLKYRCNEMREYHLCRDQKFKMYNIF